MQVYKLASLPYVFVVLASQKHIKPNKHTHRLECGEQHEGNALNIGVRAEIVESCILLMHLHIVDAPAYNYAP